MDGLTLFGLIAVGAMLACDSLEKRSHWFILAFSGSCIMASIYGFLQGAWPFGLVEAIWSAVAFRRWWIASRVWPIHITNYASLRRRAVLDMRDFPHLK